MKFLLLLLIVVLVACSSVEEPAVLVPASPVPSALPVRTPFVYWPTPDFLSDPTYVPDEMCVWQPYSHPLHKLSNAILYDLSLAGLPGVKAVFEVHGEGCYEVGYEGRINRFNPRQTTLHITMPMADLSSSSALDEITAAIITVLSEQSDSMPDQTVITITFAATDSGLFVTAPYETMVNVQQTLVSSASLLKALDVRPVPTPTPSPSMTEPPMEPTRTR